MYIVKYEVYLRCLILDACLQYLFITRFRLIEKYKLFTYIHFTYHNTS